MSVVDFIKRAAERTKFHRDAFVEQNIPNVASNIQAVCFYGNMESTLAMSSLILKPYTDVHKDKYFIMCSWPGYRGLFPYVDEYWSIPENSVAEKLALEANNFYNGASLATEISRSLLECFDVVTGKDFKEFYNHGFTAKYWDTFGEVKRYLPGIPSETYISDGFRQQLARKSGRKIIIYPSRKMWSWQRGRAVELPVSQDFWIALCERLLGDGYTPVVWQNWFTYDLSKHFVDRCVYLVPQQIYDVLAAMNYIGLVLDVHGDASKFAMLSRTPYLSVVERQIFVGGKRYEWDDVICPDLPRQYIFSFSTMLMVGDASDWETSILNNIMKKLDDFRNVNWSEGSTLESYDTVDLENIREWKSKKLGVHFIRSAREK